MKGWAMSSLLQVPRWQQLWFRISASFNDFLFRRVSKAKGWTGCSLRSGLPVQVGFIFVALFYVLFFLAIAMLTLLCELSCCALQCTRRGRNVCHSVQGKCPAVFRALNSQMCRTLKCQNIHKVMQNFLLAQIRNVRIVKEPFLTGYPCKHWWAFMNWFSSLPASAPAHGKWDWPLKVRF